MIMNSILMFFLLAGQDAVVKIITSSKNFSLLGRY